MKLLASVVTFWKAESSNSQTTFCTFATTVSSSSLKNGEIPLNKIYIMTATLHMSEAGKNRVKCQHFRSAEFSVTNDIHDLTSKLVGNHSRRVEVKKLDVFGSNGSHTNIGWPNIQMDNIVLMQISKNLTKLPDDVSNIIFSQGVTF